MEFQIGGPTNFAVSVDPPWYVYGPIPTPSPYTTYCADESLRANKCAIATNDGRFIVATRDSMAPARNVQISTNCK
jgi:hypothetical protein